MKRAANGPPTSPVYQKLKILEVLLVIPPIHLAGESRNRNTNAMSFSQHDFLLHLCQIIVFHDVIDLKKTSICLRDGEMVEHFIKLDKVYQI